MRAGCTPFTLGTFLEAFVLYSFYCISKLFSKYLCLKIGIFTFKLTINNAIHPPSTPDPWSLLVGLLSPHKGRRTPGEGCQGDARSSPASASRSSHWDLLWTVGGEKHLSRLRKRSSRRPPGPLPQGHWR